MFAEAEGARRRQVAEHNGRAWLAWNIAALQRVRKLPPIKSLMIDPERQRARARTWQQQLVVALQMTGRA